MRERKVGIVINILVQNSKVTLIHIMGHNEAQIYIKGTFI